jgi:aryl-alcohol dehydrogenase-like predicted oxidoreductase
MLRRDIETEILPFCGENGIGVICYSPLQMGILSGTFTRERAGSLAQDDLRSRNAQFTEPGLSRNLALVEQLRPIAKRRGRSVGELALAWVLRRPEVTGAIVGGRRPGQAKELAGAADWILSPEDAAEIEKALAEREATA